MRALEERSAGFYRPSPGTIYPALQLIEDEGYLTSTTVDNKRVYAITDAGREVLKARKMVQQAEEARNYHHRHSHNHGPHWGRGEGNERGGRSGRVFGPGRIGKFGADTPYLQELRQSAIAMFESVMQTACYGTLEQVAALKTLLLLT